MSPSHPSSAGPVPSGGASRGLDRARRTPRVLVVDDEADLRELVEITLVGMGLDVDCAADLTQARQLLAGRTPDLCLTDMRLPDGNGLELVADIARLHPHVPTAVITAYGSTESAVAALKAGAFDYVTKPLGVDALRTLVRSALHLGATATAGALAGGAGGGEGAGALAGKGFGAVNSTGEVVSPKRAEPDDGGLIGDSGAMVGLRQAIDRLARSMAPVAITGESGSGKELAARLIHQRSGRAQQPFVAVNCGAIPESLMEAEFFGYRRGAFTGADSDRPGFFQAADGGTLFLDEVADLPLGMQVKLLRAIQERKVRRLGGGLEEPVDVRIVSATHQDLAHCVTEGRFRQDLFYRLQVLELRMPPLRERLQDVPRLAEALLLRLARRSGVSAAPRLASVALRFLQSYHYPGNVRELENILERALAYSNGEVINVEDLGLQPVLARASENEPAPADQSAPFEASRPMLESGARPEDLVPAPGRQPLPAPELQEGVPTDLPVYLEWLEREAILKALERTHQNRTAAARLLGISFRALRYRMQRLGMQ